MNDDERLHLYGRITALEIALKNIVWTFNDAPSLVRQLREAVEPRPGVVELMPMEKPFADGYLYTVDVLSRNPKEGEPVPPP
ncbi:MAG: hypothetical protein JWQ72_1670 [Polaromonas sp.]|nr:hypothetical protein [Polaromonas sp.]